MTKPDTAAPQGMHWYYHLDRTNNRQCWYLAAEGAKVRSQQARQTASAVRSERVKPMGRTDASTDAAPFAQEPRQASPAQPTAVEMTDGQGGADENAAAPGSSNNWSFLSASPVWNTREAALTTPGFGNVQSDAVPLPAVTTPAEPAVVESHDEVAPAQVDMLVVALAGFGAMIAAGGIAAFARRKGNPPNAKRRPAIGSTPRRPGRQLDDVVRSTHQTEAPRNKTQVRRPASSSVDEIELSVRRLLHEFQAREREPRAALAKRWP
jgi:hypothetical protein